jgi:ribulose kinase
MRTFENEKTREKAKEILEVADWLEYRSCCKWRMCQQDHKAELARRM